MCPVREKRKCIPPEPKASPRQDAGPAVDLEILKPKSGARQSSPGSTVAVVAAASAAS